jgi:SAM-dependent methyltransferase
MKFYSDLSKYYQHIFPFNINQKDFIVSELAQDSGNQIFEIGCALGDTLSSLEKNASFLMGIDLNERMINEAKSRYSHNLYHFKQMDMLCVEKNLTINSFDLVYSFGNTLVHVCNNQIDNLLSQIKSLLKEKGKLLIQIINYNRVLSSHDFEFSTIDNEYINFERNYEYDSLNNTIDFKTVLKIKETDSQYYNSTKLYPIKKEELEYLLQKNGFRDLKFFGDFKNNPYDEESSYHLIVSASL